MSTKGDRNHYVPQMLLRNWANSRGLVATWRRIPSIGKLECEERGPKEIAKEYDLYTLKNTDDKERRLVEERAFGEIEARSQPILNRFIENGAGGIDSRSKKIWAIFLNSLHLRHPLEVRQTEAVVAARISEVSDNEQVEFGRLKGDVAEKTLEEWLRIQRHGYVENLHLGVLVELIVSESMLQHLMGLSWTVRELKDADCDLVLGDRPFATVPPTLETPGFLFLPIARRRLFIAALPVAIKSLNGLSPNRLVRLANKASVQRSVEYVFGDAPEKFISKYLANSTVFPLEHEHLLRSPTNAARLRSSVEDLERGGGTERKLIE